MIIKAFYQAPRGSRVYSGVLCGKTGDQNITRYTINTVSSTHSEVVEYRTTLSNMIGMFQPASFIIFKWK